MDSPGISTIVEDFRRARRKAAVQQVLAKLTGQNSELLAYDDVRRRLHGVESAAVRHQEVPLDAIVGSVGRHQDYNRAFSPLKDSDLDRWTRVKQVVTGLSGVPPIEVYKVGDAYFVKDGNHRVSVARQLGAKTIDAYVTEVSTDVPLSSDDTPDDLIVKAEYADFLERTQLHKLRPGADMRVTVPGQYERLLEHIDVHRYFMGIDEQREVSYEEAVVHWYDHVYLPVVSLLHEHGLLRDFPGRTPTDLYLWLADYRANLERDLGWTLSPDAVTYGVGEEREPQPRDVRVQRRNPRQSLLQSLLVAIDGAEAGWRALEQALHVAQVERLRLYGLHVITRVEQLEDVESVRREFARRCAGAGVKGELAIEAGGVVVTIAQRSRWTDLVVAPLNYPPGQAKLSLYGGLHTLLRRCLRPILAVPGGPSRFERPLLGYNGTPKATIALFAAAYLAARWRVRLKVVTVSEDGKADRHVLERARAYLEQYGIEADYGLVEGPIVASLLTSAREHGSDLLIVGSYEYPPLLEPILGGVLDQLLRQTCVPMLICQ